MDGWMEGWNVIKSYTSHSSEVSQLHQQSVDALLRPTFILKPWWEPQDFSISARGTFQPFKVIQGHP